MRHGDDVGPNVTTTKAHSGFDETREFNRLLTWSRLQLFSHPVSFVRLGLPIGQLSYVFRRTGIIKVRKENFMAETKTDLRMALQVAQRRRIASFHGRYARCVVFLANELNRSP